MANNRRKSAAIALAIVGIAGLSLASASQLTVTSNTLQAGSATVGQCDTDGVNVAYSYTYSGTEYVANGVTVSGIAAGCDGGQIGVTLKGTSGTAVTLASATIAGTSYTAPITAISAADLANVTVVVSK